MTGTKTVKIGEIVRINKGKKVASNSNTQTNGSRRYIQIDDLRNDNNLKFTLDSGISVKKKDVVIAWDGANAGTIGYGLDGIIGSTLAKLEIQNEHLVGDFLGRFLQSKFQYLRDRCTGATIPHISRNVLMDLEISLPTLEEQKRIVRILDQTDSLRQKRRQAISLLDDYLKALFLEMFGDPKMNPKGFPPVELKELYSDKKNGTKCGPFGSALKKEEFVNCGIPVWNMDNISKTGQMVMPFRMWITPEKYCSLEAYSVIDGDVIISRAGTVGKMCVIKTGNEKSIISTNLIRVRFGEKLLPLYFVSLMNYCKTRLGRLKTGADGTFTHMSTGVLDKLTFPYPPLNLQNKFIDIVQQVENLKQSMLEQSRELDSNFNALMQGAFIKGFGK